MLKTTQINTLNLIKEEKAVIDMTRDTPGKNDTEKIITPLSLSKRLSNLALTSEKLLQNLITQRRENITMTEDKSPT